MPEIGGEATTLRYFVSAVQETLAIKRMQLIWNCWLQVCDYNFVIALHWSWKANKTVTNYLMQWRTALPMFLQVTSLSSTGMLNLLTTSSWHNWSWICCIPRNKLMVHSMYELYCKPVCQWYNVKRTPYECWTCDKYWCTFTDQDIPIQSTLTSIVLWIVIMLAADKKIFWQNKWIISLQMQKYKAQT